MEPKPTDEQLGHVDIFFSNYYNLQSVYFELKKRFEVIKYVWLDQFGIQQLWIRLYKYLWKFSR